MRVLLIKMSSLGDLIHTLPALTDARHMYPGIEFDWVVEEAFSEIPAWHDGVQDRFVFALRRWRKSWPTAIREGDFSTFWKKLRTRRYDLIIDAQGLFKSGVIGLFAKGPLHGYHRRSVREPGVDLLYRRKHQVAKSQHAIERIRRLFAFALGYPAPTSPPDFGIRNRFASRAKKDYLVFLHGTTWPNKHWPEPYWAELANMAAAEGFRVRFPAGNDKEAARVQRIAKDQAKVELIPRCGLTELAEILSGASGYAGLDTGLAHLAGALEVPGVNVFGPSDPNLVTTIGEGQTTLTHELSCLPCKKRTCRHPEGIDTEFAPCMRGVTPDTVWRNLKDLLAARS